MEKVLLPLPCREFTIARSHTHTQTHRTTAIVHETDERITIRNRIEMHVRLFCLHRRWLIRFLPCKFVGSTLGYCLYSISSIIPNRDCIRFNWMRLQCQRRLVDQFIGKSWNQRYFPDVNQMPATVGVGFQRTPLHIHKLYIFSVVARSCAATISISPFGPSKYISYKIEFNAGCCNRGKLGEHIFLAIEIKPINFQSVSIFRIARWITTTHSSLRLGHLYPFAPIKWFVKWQTQNHICDKWVPLPRWSSTFFFDYHTSLLLAHFQLGGWH